MECWPHGSWSLGLVIDHRFAAEPYGRQHSVGTYFLLSSPPLIIDWPQGLIKECEASQLMEEETAKRRKKNAARS